MAAIGRQKSQQIAFIADPLPAATRSRTKSTSRRPPSPARRAPTLSRMPTLTKMVSESTRRRSVQQTAFEAARGEDGNGKLSIEEMRKFVSLAPPRNSVKSK